jgi:hypothetical protein
MPRKYLHLLLEIILIIIIVIVSALITNGLRADKIPLIPYYGTDTFYQTMTLNDFLQRDKKNLQVIMFDARPHALYKKDHVTLAKNFPVSEFDFFYHLYLANISQDIPIFIYGRTLSNAYDLELVYRLYRKGYKNITVLF